MDNILLFIGWFFIIIGIISFFGCIIASIRRIYALKKGIYKPIFEWLPFPLWLFSGGRRIIARDNPSYFPKTSAFFINLTKGDTKKLKEKYTTSPSGFEAIKTILRGGSDKMSLHPKVFRVLMIWLFIINLIGAGVSIWIISIGLRFILQNYS